MNTLKEIKQRAHDAMLYGGICAQDVEVVRYALVNGANPNSSVVTEQISLVTLSVEYALKTDVGLDILSMLLATGGSTEPISNNIEKDYMQWRAYPIASALASTSVTQPNCAKVIKLLVEYGADAGAPLRKNSGMLGYIMTSKAGVTNSWLIRVLEAIKPHPTARDAMFSSLGGDGRSAFYLVVSHLSKMNQMSLGLSEDRKSLETLLHDMIAEGLPIDHIAHRHFPVKKVLMDHFPEMLKTAVAASVPYDSDAERPKKALKL